MYITPVNKAHIVRLDLLKNRLALVVFSAHLDSPIQLRVQLVIIALKILVFQYIAKLAITVLLYPSTLNHALLALTLHR